MEWRLSIQEQRLLLLALLMMAFFIERVFSVRLKCNRTFRLENWKTTTGVCVMGDSLFEDVFKMILPVKALVEEAASYIEPEVKTVLQHRITDKKRIEKLLDQLLNYAGMSDKADNLYKQLCNFYYFIDPVMVSEWIVIYLDMYGNAEFDEDFVYNDDMRALIETKRVMGNDSMTIITGDKHGDFRRIDALCSLAGTTKDDLLIILGDAGINYYGGKCHKKMSQRRKCLWL